MKIIYRISDTGYNKTKPDYINNENCLSNAVKVFDGADWSIIADNISPETDNMIQTLKSKDHIKYVNIGHGAGTFNIALAEALEHSDNDIIYFLENDYLHKESAQLFIEEAINMGAHYVTLYDHPDKYIDADSGGNPHIHGGGEVTKVFLTNSSHWKLTNSTTMTFATKVKTLREDESIWRKYTIGSYPKDFDAFMELRNKKRVLVSPIPSCATHGETAWLAPLINWEKRL